MDFDDEEEQIGYCRPPKDSQFKPGQSGNPKGRPRQRPKSPRLEDLLLEIVTVEQEGKRKRMTVEEVINRKLIRRSMNGDHKALSLLDKKMERLSSGCSCMYMAKRYEDSGDPNQPRARIIMPRVVSARLPHRERPEKEKDD